MNRHLFSLLMAAAIIAPTTQAADLLTPAKYQAQVAVPVSYDYLISLPEGYAEHPEKKWPLILFLHGAGERGSDLNQLKRHGPTRLIAEGKKFPAIVVAPQCKPEQIWNPHGVKGLADEIKRSHRVDTDRVYLTGLSMGGFGTWETAMEYPQEWAALVPICGGVGVRFVMVSTIVHLPQWIFHGGKDSVVPAKYSKDMHDLLKKKGCPDVRLTIYPEAGHDSWTEAYADEELWSWLFAQKRSL
jgi:predicted peptidase